MLFVGKVMGIVFGLMIVLIVCFVLFGVGVLVVWMCLEWGMVVVWV